MLRTKKTLRALAMITALVMAFSLTSVVAFADATTVTVDAEVVDEAASKISVTGTISVDDADVTILALKDTAEISVEDLSAMDDETLASKIVYINQEAAVEKAYAFSFIPKAGVPGGIVTIFVGGEGVDAPQSTTLEVMNSGATLTVADADLTIGDDLTIGLSGLEAEDLAAWVAAITEVKVGEEVVEYTYADGAITVSGLAAGEYANIVIKATEYKDATFTGTIAVNLIAAPALSVEESVVWSEEDIVIAVEGDTAAAWLEAVEITATAGEAGVVAEVVDGSIVLSAEDYKPAIDGDVDVVVSFEAADFDAVEDITINVVSPVKDIMDNDVEAVDVDKESDAANYIITLPAGTLDITYAIEGYDATFGVVTIPRPAEGEADITVNVIVTITNAAYEEAYTYTAQTVKVNALGNDGPDVTAEDIVIEGAMEGESAKPAYGIEGATVIAIAIDEADVDPATQIVKVGEVTLSYSAERGKFVGVVTGYASVDEIIAAIEVFDDEEGTPVLNYGKATNPSSSAAISLMDVMKALAFYNNADPSATPEQYMAADVLGVGEVRLTTVMAILRVYNEPTAAESAFTVYGK